MPGIAIFGIVVVCIVIAIVAICIIGGKISDRNARRKEEARKRENQEIRQKFLSLLERAEGGELEALTEVHKIRPRYYDYLNTDEYHRWETAARHLAAKQSYKEDLQKLQSANAVLKNADQLPDRLEKLLVLNKEYQQVNDLNREKLAEEVGISKDEALELLQAAVNEYYSVLLAGREDPHSFAELWKLIMRTRWTRTGYTRENGDLRNSGVEALAFPDDWNQLVARFYDTPGIGAFQNQPERGPGDVRLLAAEAIRTDDLVNAQIALAYCNSLEGYRPAVGDVLCAELAKLVARHRAEAGDPLVSEIEQPAEQ